MPVRDEELDHSVEEPLTRETREGEEAAPDLTPGRSRLFVYILSAAVVVAVAGAALLFFLLPGKPTPQPVVSKTQETDQPARITKEPDNYIHLHGFHVELPDGQSLLVCDFTLVMTRQRDHLSENDLRRLRAMIHSQLSKKNPADLIGAVKIRALKLELSSAIEQFLGKKKEVEQVLITRFFVI